MSIDLKLLCRDLTPENTILLFGAGSSIPSGAPSGSTLAKEMAENFKIDPNAGYSLSETSTLVERSVSRKDLILWLQKKILHLKPTGAILNLPLFSWKSIYTTNYDTLIEKSYARLGKNLIGISSNFDFGIANGNDPLRLYKLHGTIEQDVSLGHTSTMVLSENDYDRTEEFRQLIYKTFSFELGSSDVVIIGYSLSDPDLKAIINETISLRKTAGASGKVTILLNAKDETRASLLESRGLQVCFGNLDDFFCELNSKITNNSAPESSGLDPLASSPSLRPVTFDAKIEATLEKSNALKMFNGSPASYADIEKGYTFPRDCISELEMLLIDPSIRVATILGAAGVGKTTTARQTLLNLNKRGLHTWEHKEDFELEVAAWVAVGKNLKNSSEHGVLLIDDCHSHMRGVNDLLEGLAKAEINELKLLLTSSKPSWVPRIKTPIIYTQGKVFELSKLSQEEIEHLLFLLENNETIKSLADKTFQGFSKSEKRRRLEDRCSFDMFVCLKNIFATEKIDDIILKEYAGLNTNYQDIYRTVAAMEAAGVDVHRQLVIRTLGIQADAIHSILDNLTDVIAEYPIDEKRGWYGWKGRHQVIVQILSDYKFSDPAELLVLFEKVIDNLIPSYPHELRTLSSLCDRKYGIGRLKRSEQNYLLRKMISIAPAERVPRHRLIQNLTAEGDYDQAEMEIRFFERDLRIDAPVQRYKILLLLRRARETAGILQEDRLAIIRNAISLARQGTLNFPQDKFLYREYCECGLAYLKYSGDWSEFDTAVGAARDAFERMLDPELGAIISGFQSKSQSIQRGQAA